ncbi:hypothetical protein [Paenibacillus hamazuiensis]|uniref:hypothetical protein n=1 Tax=Paenibacillus hamazuiensis TaxID=2936508 RepID=UPI00200EB278|nr:hypothetical protein [Paenibacillus hamazuiensis]
MSKLLMRYNKHIAILLAIALLVQMFVVFPWGTLGVRQAFTGGSTSEDGKIAADISNLTGVTVQEIMKLKQSGKSWNEVLEVLKNRPAIGQTDKESRDKLLSQSGIGEDDLDSLLAQGYSNQEIKEARFIAERLQFQLKEIVEQSPLKQVEIPSAESMLNLKNDAKKEAYEKIAEGFSLKTAVTLMLKLKKDLGSFEAVLDEYLLALQIGLELEDYLKDKAQYAKQKEEKSMGIMRNALITLSVLEQDLLDKIKTENMSVKEAFPDTRKTTDSVLQAKEANMPLPDVPLPKVTDVKPKNPTEEIRNEIRSLDPNKP